MLKSLFKSLLTPGLLLLICFEISGQDPVNENSISNVYSVLNYLNTIKGKGLLTGQENLATDVTKWTGIVYEKTGSYPAILGEDWSYGTEAYKKRLDITNAAIDYWNKGGLVSISWHQVNPDTWEGSQDEGPFEDSQAPMSQSRFDELLTSGTAIHDKYIAHIDTIAFYLKKLQDAGVVVLWRPYHEMNGGWFWWGGKSDFSELWKLMYERYTEYHQLNNLIWVWAPNITSGINSRTLSNYFPGKDYVDISGLDGYNDLENWDQSNTEKNDMDNIVSFNADAPVAFTEVGTLPDPDWIKNYRPQFVWFLCWWTHIEENSDDHIKSVYENSYSITLDELPDFRNGINNFRIKDLVNESLQKSVIHYNISIDQYTDYSRYPSSTDEAGNLKTVGSSNWVSGFYPGTLWYLYEFTEDEKFRAAAENWTVGLESQQYNTGTHDLGFMINCSYGNGYRLTQNSGYKDVILQSAISLSSRFNENTGCIRSWDWGNWNFPVIIDNMMNLELLTQASFMSGDTTYSNIARLHANTTLKNHFRSDFSSYHVVDYNSFTGEVIGKGTYQGYSDESAWARGQAWGLYGYTSMFRETGDSIYLEQAIHIADYFISGLPSDYVPYWDFDDPGIPDEPRDASAAAIAASALIELFTHAGEKSGHYLYVAEKILESLSSEEYLADAGTNANFILKHSTGNKPANSGIDVALVYADYYFVEALLRYRSLGIEINRSIPDIEVYEDSGPHVIIENLYDYFGFSMDSGISFDAISFDAGVEIKVSESGELILVLNENYSGNTTAKLLVKNAEEKNDLNLKIRVIPVNDPPGEFQLLSPAPGSSLPSLKTIFSWEEPADPDGDILSFSLHLRGSNLDTLFTGINNSQYRFDGTNVLLPGEQYQWKVMASDGDEVSESQWAGFSTPGTNGIPGEGINSLVTVYPNPFTDKLYIESPNGIHHASLYSLSGKKLMEREFNGELNVILDNCNYDNGFYILKIEEGKGGKSIIKLVSIVNPER